MVVKTFAARIANGQLQHDESLASLEGQQVRVTVVAQQANGPLPEAAEDPPNWLQVEKDVYVKMPFRGETLTNVTVVDGGRLPPCLILPEQLPHE